MTAAALWLFPEAPDKEKDRIIILPKGEMFMFFFGDVVDGAWVKQRLMVSEERRKDQGKSWPTTRNS